MNTEWQSCINSWLYGIVWIWGCLPARIYLQIAQVLAQCYTPVMVGQRTCPLKYIKSSAYSECDCWSYRQNEFQSLREFYPQCQDFNQNCRHQHPLFSSVFPCKKLMLDIPLPQMSQRWDGISWSSNVGDFFILPKYMSMGRYLPWYFIQMDFLQLARKSCWILATPKTQRSELNSNWVQRRLNTRRYGKNISIVVLWRSLKKVSPSQIVLLLLPHFT